VLVGFHERKSSFVADMTSCEVLPPHVSAMLVPLRRLVEGLSIRERMPQIELAVGSTVTALVLRILEPINAADGQRLREFCRCPSRAVLAAAAGAGVSGAVLSARRPARLHAAGVRHPHAVQADRFHAGQSPDQPRAGGPCALRLLARSRTDRVLDLFCGIGNFTLPLARISKEVVGIEGSEVLTTRALANAEENGVAGHTSFACRNLFEVTTDDLRALGHFDKFLIDPPREGALAVSKALVEIAQSGNGPLPKRIVYVSCNPSIARA
jgi:23S rRNA (uracil1939-C5)-methyltransferase